MFETEDVVIVTMCTYDEIFSLSFDGIEWFPVIGSDWKGLNVVSQVLVVFLTGVTASAAGV